MLPCDVVLISSSGLDGMCYIETKNLDGESNLKHKFAPTQLHNLAAQQADKNLMSRISPCVIWCESPNKDIYKFDGKLKLPND